MPEQKRGRGRPRVTDRPVKTGNPKVQERVPPDLADYCRAQQAATPGFLAGLIADHQRRKRLESLDELTELTETLGLYEHQKETP